MSFCIFTGSGLNICAFSFSESKNSTSTNRKTKVEWIDVYNEFLTNAKRDGYIVENGEIIISTIDEKNYSINTGISLKASNPTQGTTGGYANLTRVVLTTKGIATIILIQMQKLIYLQRKID